MSASSSPDPLALSPVTSPTRSSRRRTTRDPLAPKSSNFQTSPVKSMILEPKGAEGSPWRIRVTVQAEAACGSGKSVTRTANIPLNDAKLTSSPRRRNSRATHRTPSSRQHTANDIPELCPVSQLGEGAATDYSLSEIDLPPTPHGNNPSAANYSLSQDVELPVGASGANGSQNAEDEVLLGAYAPGDATVLESEEFSMISVDSLPSNRPAGQSSPAQPMNTTEKDSAPGQSYMPSSPPAFVDDRRTPVPSGSPQRDPNAPLAVIQHEPNIATPLRESARKSGRALQDALNGPFRDSAPREVPARDAVFPGFSSGTRRQLRQSLHIGQSLSSQPPFTSTARNVPRLVPSAPTHPTYLSPFQSPVRQERQSEIRQTHLLTPETDTRTTSRANSRSSSGNVDYPSLTAVTEQAPQLISPARAYDDMSWVATASNLQTASFNQSPQNPTLPESEVHQNQDSESKSCTSRGDDTGEGAQKEEEDKDIWQEEASRSFDNEDSPEQPDVFLEDLPIKPRRSKLPGTWRRTSGAGFHYSDSPEPEASNQRKISGSIVGSSRKSSGVITPPSSETGEAVTKKDATFKPTGDQVEESDEEEVEEVERVVTPSECTGQVSEDDTGNFWQANLPAVFIRNRPARNPSKTFSPSSPLRNTILDISPMKAIQEPNLLREDAISQAVPSPIRHSLLRSSKTRSSPVSRIREYGDVGSKSKKTLLAAESEHSETQTDSSLASDIRQLQREMKAASSAPSTDGNSLETPSEQDESISSSQLDVSRSYQEELNRDSPMRIKVNFNDSEGSSSLLEPRRNYPPLFGDVPVLAPESVEASSRESPQSRPGMMPRLTESFWEAVTKRPVYVAEPKRMIVVEPASEAALGVPDHVLRLRRKYGLLPDVHPFTYAHIRTLHRMLNSTRSRPGASIIPRSGPLSHNLSRLLGKTKTNELDQRFVWTSPLLHVVDSFMSLLLPAIERERLQQTGTWGDEEAIRHRGRDSKGRRGNDAVFAGVKGGLIEASWIADVLVDIVFKEEMNTKKKKVAEMIARAEKWERMEK